MGKGYYLVVIFYRKCFCLSNSGRISRGGLMPHRIPRRKFQRHTLGQFLESTQNNQLYNARWCGWTLPGYCEIIVIIPCRNVYQGSVKLRTCLRLLENKKNEWNFRISIKKSRYFHFCFYHTPSSSNLKQVAFYRLRNPVHPISRILNFLLQIMNS